jgi:hypothetical protein
MKFLYFFLLSLSLTLSNQQLLGAPLKPSILKCESSFSDATKLPKGAKVLGVINANKLSLLDAGLVLGKTAEITNSVMNEEILDEWKLRTDGSEETLAVYDKGHQDLILRCTYKSAESASASAKTIVLIPLPDKPISCHIVKKADRVLSANCKVK